MRIRTVLLGCWLASAAVFAAEGDPGEFADQVGMLCNGNSISRMAPDGAGGLFVTVAGGAGTAYITQSKGIFYVTRILSNQIVRISADGEIRQIAGTGRVGHDAGPAASPAHPNGIAATSARRKTLDLEPGHALARARLTQLDSGNSGN